MNDRSATSNRRLLVAALAVLGACIPAKLDLFESGPTGEPVDTGSTTGGAGTDAPGDPTATAATTAITTGPTEEPGPCEAGVTNCADDVDRDGVVDACDNAPVHTNPGQSDLDLDGIGDLADLCPTLANADNPTADSDRDGIGNACDPCGRQVGWYNRDVVIPARMKVRNIPQVEDSDHDGIGDVCDNCVRTPNCQGYGDGLDPFTLGDAIDEEAADCQPDADNDLVGDACAGTMMPGAAGPVGFGDDDDFDQDGLANLVDVCPRQPVTLQACVGPEDCLAGAACTAGVCNHSDADSDGVGDICDTCPWNANPIQVQDGGMQVDDADADFVGQACETNPACNERSDPRPIGFYDGSVGGYCCVQLFDGGTVLDPNGDPVAPPATVLARPGVGVLPPGCEQEAQPIDGADGLDAMWAGFCLLPQQDQDLDGVGYICDLCPFAFDPGQELQQAPNIGKFCHGEFDPAELDPTMMCLPGT